jgi:hypothetical protein
MVAFERENFWRDRTAGRLEVSTDVALLYCGHLGRCEEPRHVFFFTV